LLSEHVAHIVGNAADSSSCISIAVRGDCWRAGLVRARAVNTFGHAVNSFVRALNAALFQLV